MLTIYGGKAWLIDTYDGCEVVPDDLVDIHPFCGRDEPDYESHWYSQWIADAIEQLHKHCHGPIIDVPDCPTVGWIGRASAESPWHLFETEDEARMVLTGAIK
jgi:hypothetical protein